MAYKETSPVNHGGAEMVTHLSSKSKALKSRKEKKYEGFGKTKKFLHLEDEPDEKPRKSRYIKLPDFPSGSDR